MPDDVQTYASEETLKKMVEDLIVNRQFHKAESIIKKHLADIGIKKRFVKCIFFISEFWYRIFNLY